MEKEEKKSVYTGFLGNIEVKLTSDVFDGEILDTKVEVFGNQLCWVSGEKRMEFLTKMNEIINEFRI